MLAECDVAYCLDPITDLSGGLTCLDLQSAGVVLNEELFLPAHRHYAVDTWAQIRFRIGGEVNQLADGTCLDAEWAHRSCFQYFHEVHGVQKDSVAYQATILGEYRAEGAANPDTRVFGRTQIRCTSRIDDDDLHDADVSRHVEGWIATFLGSGVRSAYDLDPL
jgi:hypothetical protein